MQRGENASAGGAMELWKNMLKKFQLSAEPKIHHTLVLVQPSDSSGAQGRAEAALAASYLSQVF